MVKILNKDNRVKIFYSKSNDNNEKYFDNTLIEELSIIGHDVTNAIPKYSIDDDERLCVKDIEKEIDDCDVCLCNVTQDIMRDDDNDNKNNLNVIYEYFYAKAKQKPILIFYNGKKNDDGKLPTIYASAKFIKYEDIETMRKSIDDVKDFVRSVSKKCKKRNIDENDFDDLRGICKK